MRQALFIFFLVLAVVAHPALPALAQSATSPDANYDNAHRWYENSARRGSPMAQFLLGYKLENGVGIERDAVQAARWYRAAAAQGHARAQFRLGWMRQNGVGLSKDMAKAVSWYVSAAAQGIAGAALNLGYIYERGLGVAADRDKARHYYTQAARQGLGDAQLNLGLLLAGEQSEATSEQMRASLTEGGFWLSLAAAQNVSGAETARLKIMDTLSADEIRTVEKKVAAYKVRKAVR